MYNRDMTKSDPPRDLIHEMKRHLTHLQSHIFMAEMAYRQGDTERAQEYLRRHDQTIQRLSTLIDDLFGRGESQNNR